MSTKNNPGAWRCYESALPDEPFFTILARDPAGPATLRFWAGQRILAGKLGNPEDEDRIINARQEADEMEAWREANLDPVGDGSGPSWKLLAGINDDELGPVRSLPDSTVYIYAERDGSEAVRVSIKWLRNLSGQLTRGDITREFHAELIEAACQSPDCRRERVVPVEEAAYDAARRDDRAVSLMNAINSAVAMLDDLRNLHDAGKRLDPIRATLVNAVLNISIDSVIARQTDPDPYAVYAAGLHHKDTVGEAMPRSVGKSAALGMGFVVDSAPDDLAHGPEVPPHRFSTFHKGKRYAYARGLEINPIHLPTALDAMAEDGWHLLAIFGQTDSEHVGFIFQREQRAVYIPSGLDLTYGFGMPFEKPNREGPEYHRFMAGEPLDDIREDQPRTGAVVTPADDPCGPEGRGRGLEP